MIVSTLECPAMEQMNDVVNSSQPDTVVPVKTPDGAEIKKIEVPTKDVLFITVITDNGTVIVKVRIRFEH